MSQLIKKLWGDITSQELTHFLFLGLGCFLLIGSYWPLKVLKNVIFINTVGYTYLPYAKNFSLLLFFPTLMLYSWLIERVEKKRLLRYCALFYACIGIGLSALLLHPSLGLNNIVASPYRVIGWLFFLFVENYISIMNSLYWGYINDVTSAESAKKGYGLLIFMTQAGALLFLLLGSSFSENPEHYSFVTPIISLFSALTLGLFGLLVGKFGPETHGKLSTRSSFIESFVKGIDTFRKYPYAFNIFGIILMQYIVETIFSYQLSVHLFNEIAHHGARSIFMFKYGIITQIIACIFAITGTSIVQRNLSVSTSLIMFPVILLITLLATMQTQTLYVATGIVILIKVLGYALNQPLKESLYIPTPQEVKYATKGWIDIFGERFAKGTGSQIIIAFGQSSTLVFCTIASLLGWIYVGRRAGKSYEKLTASGSETNV